MPLSERPSIASVKAAPAPASAASNNSMSFLSSSSSSSASAKAIQIDDPNLVSELKDSEMDDLVSEVILALNDRSLPLKMRDTSATLLKGFRSQDATARALAMEIAANV